MIDAGVKVEADGSLTFRTVTTSFRDKGVLAIRPMLTHWQKR